MGIQITGRVFCSLWAGTEAPSTSVTTPLRGDSGWPVPPPVAQTLCLGDARSFFMSTFISHHLFFTSATLRPSEATAFTLCATCCHSRAFSASVTRPNAVHQIIQPSSSPPPDKNFLLTLSGTVLPLSAFGMALDCLSVMLDCCIYLFIHLCTFPLCLPFVLVFFSIHSWTLTSSSQWACLHPSCFISDPFLYYFYLFFTSMIGHSGHLVN